MVHRVVAGQPGESKAWAIDILALFTVGKVRGLAQSRWWSTTSCLFGREDMAFSWSIVLREELVLPLRASDICRCFTVSSTVLT